MGTYCHNCGSEVETTKKFDSDLGILECDRCKGWMFQSSQEINLSEIYSKKYYSGHEYLSYEMGENVYKSNFVRKLNKIREVISMYPQVEWRILEIGCATGAFLDILKENNFKNLLGLEVSDYAREVSQDKGYTVLNPLDPAATSKIEEFKPNLIIAWDVWEHLTESAKMVEDIFKISDQNTIIALSTVDVSAAIPKLRKTAWRQFHPPSHINYPSRKSFEIFFKKNNFEIVKLEAFGYSRPVADYMAVFLGKFKRVLCKIPFLFKIPFYLNLGDIQFVIAKRGTFGKDA